MLVVKIVSEMTPLDTTWAAAIYQSSVLPIYAVCGLAAELRHACIMCINLLQARWMEIQLLYVLLLQKLEKFTEFMQYRKQTRIPFFIKKSKL